VTTNKLYAVLLVGAVMISAPWQGVEARKEKSHPTTGPEGLFYAAGGCVMPLLKSLIASGVSLTVTDAQGFDALSHASLNRDMRPYKPKTAYKLNCPQAVTALTEAGADPWKAGLYQNPSLNDTQPETIAVISVTDNRAEKGKSEKIMQEMTHGVELQLHGGHGPGKLHLSYPIVPLNDARQKLLAAGFSADEAIAPDRTKACKVLGTDSVFEASLEDYRSKNVGVASSAGMRMKFALTDCKTGNLLWRSDQNYSLAVGFLIGTFGGAKVQETITGSVSGTPAIAFPYHQKEK
jgi:hypothetical protein